MVRDVSKAKTIAVCDKISKLNINVSAVCGYRTKNAINIARLSVNTYCITAPPMKSVTQISF